MDHGTLDISISLHTAIFGQKLHNPSVKIVVMKEIAQNPLTKYFWNILKNHSNQIRTYVLNSDPPLNKLHKRTDTTSQSGS